MSNFLYMGNVNRRLDQLESSLESPSNNCFEFLKLDLQVGEERMVCRTFTVSALKSTLLSYQIHRPFLVLSHY